VVATAALLWGALGIVAAPLRAQGTVAGTVRILERGAKASKDLTNAIVYLEGDGGTLRAGSALDNANVDMKGREFVPHVQIVRAGGSVGYPNKDPFSHNVFSNSALGAFDLGLYRTGASRATVFPKAGVYEVYCNIHARMVNFVIAVNTPWVTRVNADGTFQIKGVPAGTYRMHVWHERGSESVQTVTIGGVGVGGMAIALDARTFTAAPHPDKFGKAYAATRADRY